MATEDKVIEIFYMADEYSKELSNVRHKYSLGEERNFPKNRLLMLHLLTSDNLSFSDFYFELTLFDNLYRRACQNKLPFAFKLILALIDKIESPVIVEKLFPRFSLLSQQLPYD